MKNRLLSMTRRMIPYIPALNAITGSVDASILMQQLDYWFEKYPSGFYKFMEPCGHHLYKEDQSWTEELGFSRSEFRNAFDSLGVRFGSKSEFATAPDKFMGRMYASYVDKKSNLTHYHRNHELVDRRLEELLTAKTPQVNDSKAHPDPSVADANSSVVSATNPSVTHANPSVTHANPSVTHANPSVTHANPSVTATISTGVESGFPSVTDSISTPQGISFTPLPTTDNTTDITSKKLLLQGDTSESEPTSRSSGVCDKPKKLYYPDILGAELKQIEKALEFCPENLHQDVLDEIEGIRASGKIARGAVPLAKGLIKKIVSGEFQLSAGTAVRAKREHRLANEAAVIQSSTPTILGGTPTEEQISKMPPNIRRRMLASMTGAADLAGAESADGVAS